MDVSLKDKAAKPRLMLSSRANKKSHLNSSDYTINMYTQRSMGNKSNSHKVTNTNFLLGRSLMNPTDDLNTAKWNALKRLH